MSRAPFFINPMMRELFRDWLRTCFGVGFASGQSLFDACITAAEGKCFVDSSEPDQILRGAENSGWVHRAQNSAGGFTLEPKLIQRFAGLGGLSWSSAIAVKGAMRITATCTAGNPTAGTPMPSPSLVPDDYSHTPHRMRSRNPKGQFRSARLRIQRWRSWRCNYFSDLGRAGLAQRN